MWIKTSERLPELLQSIEPGIRKSPLVLIYNPYVGASDSGIETGRLLSVDNDEPHWEIDKRTYDLKEIDIWCPIPELPGE